MASSTRSIAISGAALNSLLNGPNGPVAQELVRRGELIANRQRATAPVKTGNLRRHIRTQLTSAGGELAVRAGVFGRSARSVPYLRFVTGGTRTPIRPRRARVMRFVVNGRVVYATEVRGQPPNNFLQDAIEAGRG